jgi:phospho-N-acetylmuramoyl-pentapeptide-transferase
MGDTGSLTIGGIIAVLAIAVRKEMLIFIVRYFLVENLSVVLQVSYFKYTKKRFGEGRRIFLMSPIIIIRRKAITKAKLLPVLDCCDYAAILSIVTLKLR